MLGFRLESSIIIDDGLVPTGPLATQVPVLATQVSVLAIARLRVADWQSGSGPSPRGIYCFDNIWCTDLADVDTCGVSEKEACMRCVLF
jgi:hypothetical protein